MKLECEMCAGSKWKSACPECDGTGRYTPDPEPNGGTHEKIRYWWSDDRQWFCLRVNDGTAHATVSLTADEADKLVDEAVQTPQFLALEAKGWEQAKELMQKAADFATVPDPVNGPFRRARIVLEDYIATNGLVFDIDKLREAIAAELGLAEIRGADRTAAQPPVIGDNVPDFDLVGRLSRNHIPDEPQAVREVTEKEVLDWLNRNCTTYSLSRPK